MRKVCDERHSNNAADTSVDLTRRLVRYRTRVEAEGRKRSLKLIDRAIKDAAEGTGADN